MTLQAGEPSSASFRVLVALRLLHLRLPRHTTSFSAPALEPWYDVVNGTSDTISQANEDSVRLDVVLVAEAIATNRAEGVGACDKVEKEWRAVEGIKLEMECLGMLKGIWEGERTISEAVRIEGTPK